MATPRRELTLGLGGTLNNKRVVDGVMGARLEQQQQPQQQHWLRGTKKRWLENEARDSAKAAKPHWETSFLPSHRPRDISRISESAARDCVVVISLSRILELGLLLRLGFDCRPCCLIWCFYCDAADRQHGDAYVPCPSLTFPSPVLTVL